MHLYYTLKHYYYLVRVYNCFMLLWKHNSHGNLEWALHLNRIISQPQSFLPSFFLILIFHYIFASPFSLFTFNFLLLQYFSPERLMNVVSLGPHMWKCPWYIFTLKTTWLGIKFRSCIFFPSDFVSIVPLCSSIAAEIFCANLISAYTVIWFSYLDEQMNILFLKFNYFIQICLRAVISSVVFLGRLCVLWTCRFMTLFPDFYFSITLNIFIPFVSHKVYFLANLCLSFMPVITQIFGYPQKFFFSI